MASDAVKQARGEMQAASSQLSKCLGGAAGAESERRYGQAYQRLVKLGEEAQIRRKYRFYE